MFSKLRIRAVTPGLLSHITYMYVLTSGWTSLRPPPDHSGVFYGGASVELWDATNTPEDHQQAWGRFFKSHFLWPDHCSAGPEWLQPLIHPEKSFLRPRCDWACCVTVCCWCQVMRSPCSGPCGSFGLKSVWYKPSCWADAWTTEQLFSLKSGKGLCRKEEKRT